MTTTLPTEGSAAALRGKIAGEVFEPGDPGYEELCWPWNRAYRHRPKLIVVPAWTGDVCSAVLHAVNEGLTVSVQATGHGVAKPADGAMLLLTHRMTDVSVDADAWTARLGAGAKWQQVLGPAIDAGLAPILGSTPDVSAAGYTLGGGMGWISRKFGLSADNVRSIEIVTADGQVRHACPEDESDLFWALRGGGAGSLGVVTEIVVDLVPVESLYAGNLLYPASMAREVAARYRRWIEHVPDELTSALTLMNFPPLEDVPEPMRGQSFVIIRGAFIGPDDEGSSLLRHWRDWRTPALDMWGRIPFSEVATISADPLEPTPNSGSTAWLADLEDATVEVLVRALFERSGPSPLLFAEVRHCGGAMARQPEVPNAYGNRHHDLLLEVVGITPTPESFELTEQFTSALLRELGTHVEPGAYLNFLEGDEKLLRSHEGFQPEAWERLRSIKAVYDPTNVFSHGIAIA